VNFFVVLAVLVAPVFASHVLISSEHVRISIAPVILIFTYPTVLWLIFWCYGWAHPTRLWHRSTPSILTSPNTSIIPNVARLRRLLITWTLVVVVWTLSVMFAYTHVYLQVVIHIVVVMICLGIGIAIDSNRSAVRAL
jgi:hypothetical protein